MKALTAYTMTLGIAAVVGTTAVSLRLLGLRRGWGRAAAAGLVGWTVAVLLALKIADWHWGADGLVLHIVAIAIPATMAEEAPGSGSPLSPRS